MNLKKLNGINNIIINFIVILMYFNNFRLYFDFLCLWRFIDLYFYGKRILC